MLNFHSGLTPGIEPGLLRKHEEPMHGHEARQAETLTRQAGVLTPPRTVRVQDRGGRHSWCSLTKTNFSGESDDRRASPDPPAPAGSAQPAG